MAKFSDIGVYAPKVEEIKQERPTWDASSFVGQFIGGYIEGLTTFDVLGYYNVTDKADTTPEYIARSLGSVLGFVGFGPASLGKAVFGTASKAARLLGEIGKAEQFAKTAASFRPLNFSVPMRIGEMSKNAVNKYILESSAAKNMLKFGEQAVGGLSAATKTKIGTYVDSALFMGFASAAGARPINPLEVFTSRDFHERANAFLHGAAFGIGQRIPADIFTPKSMKFLEAMQNSDPENAELLMKSLRAVSTGLTMGGYALANGYPSELALYETLVNGVFGWRELPWYDKRAREIEHQYFNQNNLYKWMEADLAKVAPKEFLKQQGLEDIPDEVANSFELSMTAQHGSRKKVYNAIIESMRPAVAEKKNIPVELVSNDILREAIGIGDVDNARAIRFTDSYEEVYNQTEREHMDRFMEENQRLPEDDEMPEFDRQVQTDMGNRLAESITNGQHSMAYVKAISRQVNLDKTYTKKWQDVAASFNKEMREKGLSASIIDTVAEFTDAVTEKSGIDGIDAIREVGNTFFEQKETGRKEFLPVKQKLEKRFNVTFKPEEEQSLLRLWQQYAHSEKRDVLIHNQSDGSVFVQDVTKKDGTPIHRNEPPSFFELATGHKLFYMLYAKEGDGTVSIHKAKTPLSKIIADADKGGYIFVGADKDNENLIFTKAPLAKEGDTWKLGGLDLSMNVESELRQLNPDGSSLEIYNKERAKYIDEALLGVKDVTDAMKEAVGTGYDKSYAYNAMTWKYLNNKETLRDLFEDTESFPLTSAFKMNKRQGLFSKGSSGIPMDKSLAEKEKYTARIVDWDKSSVGLIKDVFGNYLKEQDDGVIAVRRKDADNIGKMSAVFNAGFHKATIVHSDDKGMFIGKFGFHVLTEAEEKAMNDAGITEDMLVFPSAAKQPGQRQTTILHYDGNRVSFGDIPELKSTEDALALAKVLTPSQYEVLKRKSIQHDAFVNELKAKYEASGKIEDAQILINEATKGQLYHEALSNALPMESNVFELPVEAVRVNTSVREDSKMGAVQMVKQMIGHIQEDKETADVVYNELIAPRMFGDKYKTFPTVETSKNNNFLGYKGGFENKGKGTPEGDGKDKAMREVADGFIGEIVKENSSSATSKKVIEDKGFKDPNSWIVQGLKARGLKGNRLFNDPDLQNQSVRDAINIDPSLTEKQKEYVLKTGSLPPAIVMLARNSEFKGKPLNNSTKEKIKEAYDNGASFVVGDMPNVDSQFIDYLKEIGAKFTVYHTGENPRLTAGENIVKTAKGLEQQDYLTHTKKFENASTQKFNADIKGIDIDEVSLPELWKVLQDLPNDARLPLLAKFLMKYQFSQGDEVEGDEANDLENIQALLKDRSAVNMMIMAAKGELSPAFFAQPLVRNYMEDAMFRYTVERMTKPKIANSGKVKLGWLSPIEATLYKKRTGKDFDENVVLAGSEQRNKPIVFEGKKTTLGKLWDRLNIIPIKEVDAILSERKIPVAARNTGNEILINKKLLQQKFIEKAWMKPAVEGVLPLKRNFNTYKEWENFVIAHERAHSFIKQEKNESKSDYENRINQSAEHFEKLQKFFDNVLNVRVPLSDPSGARNLQFGGFVEGGGWKFYVHPYNMKYMDGADLDGDSAFFYMGLPDKVHEYFSRPKVKHRFSKWTNADGSKTFDIKNVPEELLNGGTTYNGETYTKDFAPNAGDVKSLLSGEDYTLERSKELLFSPRARALANRIASLGRQNLGPGLVAMQRAKQLWHFLDKKGFLNWEGYVIRPKPTLDEQRMAQFSVVNTSADASNGDHPMTTPDRVRAASVLSAVDIYKDGKKLSEEDAMNLLSERKGSPGFEKLKLNSIPVISQIKDVDYAIQQRTFSGDRIDVGQIFGKLSDAFVGYNEAVNADLSSPWYKGIELINKNITYEPRPGAFLNADSYKVFTSIFDRFFKNAHTEPSDFAPLVPDNFIARFLLQLMGKQGLSITNSKISETSAWKDYLKPYFLKKFGKDKTNEMLNEFIQSYDFRNTRLWKESFNVEVPGTKGETINGQERLRTELAQESLTARQDLIKYDTNKIELDFIWAGGKKGHRIFGKYNNYDRNLQEMNDFIMENGVSVIDSYAAIRPSWEQTKEADNLAIKDLHMATSASFMSKILSDHIVGKKFTDFAEAEDYAKNVLVPKLQEYALDREKLITSQQDAYISTKDYKAFNKLVNDLAAKRNNMKPEQQKLFDMIMISSIQPNLGNGAKPERLEQWKRREYRKAIDRLGNKKMTKKYYQEIEATAKKKADQEWIYDTYYATTPQTIGLVDGEMLKEYYKSFGEVSNIITNKPENIDFRSITRDLQLDPLGVTPLQYAGNVEVPRMNKRSENKRIAKDMTAVIKKMYAIQDGIDKNNRLKDIQHQSELDILTNRLSQLWHKHPEVLENLPTFFPIIAQRRTGAGRGIEFATIDDLRFMVDLYEKNDKQIQKYKDSHPGVDWTMFAKKIGMIADDMRPFAKNFQSIDYTMPVRTLEGPVHMKVTDILAPMDAFHSFINAFQASKSAGNSIVNEFFNKSMHMVVNMNFEYKNHLNKRMHDLGSKMFSIAVTDLERNLVEINSDGVVVKGYAYDQYAKEGDELLNQIKRDLNGEKIRIQDLNGKTVAYTPEEAIGEMKKRIQDYQTEFTKWLNDNVHDKDVIKFTGKRYGTNGQFEEIDTDKSSDEAMKFFHVNGYMPLLSRKMNSMLALGEILKTFPVEIYHTNKGIFFGTSFNEEGRKAFEDKMSQVESYSKETKKFYEMSEGEQNKFIDSIWDNGYVFGFNVGDTSQPYGKEYFPHSFISEKEVLQHLRTQIENLHGLPVGDLKNTSLDVLQMVHNLNSQEYDAHEGQHIFTSMMGHEDPLSTVRRKNAHLRQRDDNPLYGWDHSPSALKRAHDKIARESIDMTFAVLGKNMLRRFSEKNVFGDTENTLHMTRFLERHIRQSLGFPDIQPKEWTKDGGTYNYGMKNNPWKFHSDDYYVNLFEKSSEWLGTKGYGNFSEVDRIADKINFKSDKDKLEWKTASKRALAEKKLSWLSQMEAKWSLLSLLTSTKTFTTNVATGYLSTLFNTSFQDFTNAFSLKAIQNEIGMNNVQSKGDVEKLFSPFGIFEGMLQQEIEIGTNGVIRQGSRAMAEAIKQLQEKKWSDVSLKDIAEREGLLKSLTEKGASFMKSSELIIRKHSAIAHYLNMRRAYKQQGFDLAWDDPWIIKGARDGVAASQFLYSNATRPAFMGSLAGKIFHRFQLFAYNAIEFRSNIIKQAKMVGIAPGNPAYEKFQNMMLADMFVMGMASMIPMSLFNTMLPPPYNYMQSLVQFFFGKNEKERQNAFYGGLPYPLNITQPLTPPAARGFISLLNYAYSGDVEKLGQGLYTMIPGQRFIKDVWNTYTSIKDKHRNPAILIDNMTGIPLVNSGSVIRRLEKDNGFDMYLERYRNGSYLPEQRKEKEDIQSYIDRMSSQ